MKKARILSALYSFQYWGLWSLWLVWCCVISGAGTVFFTYIGLMLSQPLLGKVLL
ncbi:hypothetical protein [Entomobacter blattae]|uniref:hypothetical protein n=1 Tax=Entomobacter blattae TaxID=2762277 RepID=UPI00193B3E36|nr:hypothetical protein [Entomobacter blattae]